MAHVKITVWLPDELLQRLDCVAASRRVPRSAVVALALKRYFDRDASLLELIDSALDSLTDDDRTEDAIRADATSNRTLQRLRSERW